MSQPASHETRQMSDYALDIKLTKERAYRFIDRAREFYLVTKECLLKKDAQAG